MPTMSDVTNEVFFALFTGEPGKRKSTQALSFPKPQYWFDFDGKMKALTIPMRLWNIDPKDISFDRYSDWTRAQKKLEDLTFNCPYKTVVIDSITSLADYALRQVIKNKTGTTKASGAAAGKQVAGIPVNEIEDFNAESAVLTELIALLKQIHENHKANIILIAHVIRTEQKSLDGSVNVSRVIVTAGKKPAAKLPAYCDEIYSFAQDKSMDPSKGGDYVIHTQFNGEDFGRTTLPLAAKIIVGDGPLYDNHIKPAITKQKENKS